MNTNRVVHFEIPADDMKRAQEFYETTFGWGLTQMGPDMGGYVVLRTGPTDEQGMLQDKGFINGGLFERDATAKGPIVVLAVDDCDAMVEKVQNAGGKLVGEILDIPGVGRYARVEDTEGNMIAMIKPIMR